LVAQDSNFCAKSQLARKRRGSTNLTREHATTLFALNYREKRKVNRRNYEKFVIVFD
jgi:hypothetical protein